MLLLRKFFAPMSDFVCDGERSDADNVFLTSRVTWFWMLVVLGYQFWRGMKMGDISSGTG